MRYRLPPLNALRAFEAAGRHLSFTEAAAELCVTQGAVSRHIILLEQHLGTRLFDRLHRGIRLTPEGADYLLTVQAAMERLSEATDRITVRKIDNSLHFQSLPTFGIRWLVPRLADFATHHPEVRVQLNTRHSLVDFEREDADAGVGYGVGAWKKLTAELLFPETLIPVCAPRLADGTGPPSQPRELERCVLLHSLKRPLRWQRWLQSVGVQGPWADDGPRFENSGLAYQGAMDGLGVAMAELAFVMDDLASGRLVAPFAHTLSGEESYYLVYPPGKAKMLGLAVFRRWILQRAEETRARLREFAEKPARLRATHRSLAS